MQRLFQQFLGIKAPSFVIGFPSLSSQNDPKPVVREIAVAAARARFNGRTDYFFSHFAVRSVRWIKLQKNSSTVAAPTIGNVCVRFAANATGSSAERSPKIRCFANAASTQSGFVLPFAILARHSLFHSCHRLSGTLQGDN